jgi:hypothetical protein
MFPEVPAELTVVTHAALAFVLGRGTIWSRTDCLRQGLAGSYSELAGIPVHRELHGNADQPNVVNASVTGGPPATVAIEVIRANEC